MGGLKIQGVVKYQSLRFLRNRPQKE